MIGTYVALMIVTGVVMIVLAVLHDAGRTQLAPVVRASIIAFLAEFVGLVLATGGLR